MSQRGGEMSWVCTLTVLTCTIYGCATQNYGPYSSQTACFTAGRQVVNAQQISCRARRVFDDRVFDDRW
jgi:hypothetical protein